MEFFRLTEGEPAEGAAIGGTAGPAAPDAAGQPAVGPDSPGAPAGAPAPADGGQPVLPESFFDAKMPKAYATARGFVDATPREMGERLRQANQRIADLEREQGFAQRLAEQAGTVAAPTEEPGEEAQSLEDYVREYGDHPVVKELVGIRNMLAEQKTQEIERANVATAERGKAIFANVCSEELPKYPELKEFPLAAGLIQSYIGPILEEKIRQVEVDHMYDGDKTAIRREKWAWANDTGRVSQIVREAVIKARDQVKGYELSRYKSKSAEVATGLEAGKKAAVLGGGGQPPVIGQEQKTETTTADRVKGYLAQREAEATRIAREGLR